MANTALNRTGQLLLTNKSGGSVAQGDVVVVDTTTAASFTTTTTSGYVSGAIGVVLEPNGIANNAIGMVAVQGYVPVINLSGTGSIGDLVKTHTVAKQGVRNAAPVVAGNFAQALGTSATPVAILWGIPYFGSGTGVTRSGATTDGHLAVWNGSSADSIKDGGVPSIVKISTQGSGASFDFTSIPGTYTDLKITMLGRGDTATTALNMHMRLNNDTGSNYDLEVFDAGNTALTGAGIVASANSFIGLIPGSSATANQPGNCEIIIPAYASTTFFKRYTAVGGMASSQAVGGQSLRTTSGQWRNTAAVTRVTIYLDSGNFVAGSTATLYGLG